MTSHHFRGSFAVTITPFTDDGSKIDFPAWKRFLDWQLAEGVPGIIILGTTGEFLTLTDDERSSFVEATVKHIKKRIPVLVGSMNAYTPNAVRYSREAEELGADGLMIIPPYYYTPTDDEIFAYYKAICDKVSIPIMLYNNPFTSNVDMSAKLVGAPDQGLRADPLHQGSEPGHGARLRHHRGDQGGDERVRRPAHRRKLHVWRRRLREPLRQLHAAPLDRSSATGAPPGASRTPRRSSG